MHSKNYRSFRMVQDGSSVRSTYLESCIHGLSRGCCIHKPATILPQKLHWSSMTRQNNHNQKLYAPVTHSRGSSTFRTQDPACKIEFRTILCLKYTLPPSTTLPGAHIQTDIWTIAYRTMHHPSITN